MKHTLVPNPFSKPKAALNWLNFHTLTIFGRVLMCLGFLGLLSQAKGAWLSCAVSSVNLPTAVSYRVADHSAAEDLAKRNMAGRPGVVVSSARPRIISPEHDQIFVSEDVKLTVEPGIERMRCDLGRYQLVWLRARVEPDAPLTLAWTIWQEGPTQISCGEPMEIKLPSELFGNSSALYIVNVRYVSDQFKGPWSRGRLFRWLNDEDFTPKECKSGVKIAR